MSASATPAGTAPKADARSRFIRGGRRKSERLTITLEGEPLEVEVRALSAGVRGDLMTDCVKTGSGEDGEEAQRVDLGQMYPRLIIASLYDVDSGEPIFEEADLDVVRGLDASVFDPVIKVASRLSALGVDASKVMKGNSDATTGSGSASASPEN